MEKNIGKIDIVLLLLTNILWSIAVPLTGYAIQFLTPMFFYSIRFFLSGIFSCWFFKLEKKEILKIFILGTLQTITFVGVGFGIKYLDSSTTSIILRLDTILTIALSALILKEKITINLIFSFILCFLGMYIISGNISFNNLPYLFLLLFANLCTAASNILIKYIKTMESKAITAWTSLVMGVEFIFITIYMGGNVILQEWNYKIILIIIYSSIFPTFVCYAMFYYLLKKFKNTTTMPLQFARMIFSIIFSKLILNESITTNKLFAMILIMSGMWISQIKKIEKTNAVRSN